MWAHGEAESRLCKIGIKNIPVVGRREMWVHDEAETPKAARKKKGRGYDIS
jgi:hypothetical protein